MKFINKTTKEVYETVGDVRKALAPIKLPKVLTKEVLEDNDLAYLYDTVKPITGLFQELKEDGIKLVNGKFQYTYTVQEVFTPAEREKIKEDALKQAKLNQIETLKKQLDDIVSKKLIECALTEKLSWDKQEKEARAVLADSEAETPYLSILVITRDKDETVLELAEKIVAKVDT